MSGSTVTLEDTGMSFPSVAKRRRIFQRIALLVLWAALFAYLAHGAYRGWIPHDEGLLGQTAERVLQGELPHRDFDDPYTGGLSLLHALAFKLLGLELTSLRTFLLFFSALFMVALYRVARRFAAPFTALQTTLLAAAWSLPIYFAALPSWYNLFCAVFGALALCKFVENEQRRWLFIAGVLGGVSFLFKTIGLFYIAAVLLVLLYRDASLARSGSARPGMMDRGVTASRSDILAWRLLIACGLLVFCLLLAELLFHQPSIFRMLLFFLPSAALCVFILWHERRVDDRRFRQRLRTLVTMSWPFLVGVILPIAAFLLPYVLTGSLGAFIHGVFVLPRKRFELATVPLPPLWTALLALPVTVLLGWTAWRRRQGWSQAVTGLAILSCGLVLFWGDRPTLYRGFWFSTRPLVPAVVLVGCWLLLRHDRAVDLSFLRRQQLFLLLAMAACVSLVQLDNAFAVYFAYTAPVLVLAILAVLSVQDELGQTADRSSALSRPAWRAWAAVAALYILFALLWVHRGLVLLTGIEYLHVEQKTPLELERGGLEISKPMAQIYGELTDAVSELSAPGSYIYATPDCPEVYFLTTRRNPTRTFFELFDDDLGGHDETRTQRILDLLKTRQVALVVLNDAPLFSREVDPTLTREIRSRYPRSTRIGPFILHW